MMPHARHGKMSHVAWTNSSRVAFSRVMARVADRMQPPALLVRPNDSLVDAAQMLQQHGIDLAAVVAPPDDRPIGILTARDVMSMAMEHAERADELMSLAGGAPEVRAISDVRVAEAINPTICCSVAPEMTLSQAAAAMAYEDASYALVLSQTGALCGMIGATQIANWLAESDGYLMPARERYPQRDATERVVMAVEDEPDIADSMRDILELEGYRVVVARNGRDALEQLELADRRPSLILLDLMMPEMDGWEFRRKQLSRPALAAIPVVVVSAYTDRSMPELPNPAALLRKPISVERLLDAVHTHCAI